MKTKHLPLMFVVAVLITGCSTPPSTRHTAHTPTSEALSASATPDPRCVGKDARITVEVPAEAKAGDTLIVTVRLHNEGCGRLGMPGFGFEVSADGLGPLTNPAYTDVPFDRLMIEPGEIVVATKELRLLRPGQVTITASASFEFIEADGIGMSWRGVRSEPVPLTILTAEGGPPPPTVPRPTNTPPTPTPAK